MHVSREMYQIFKQTQAKHKNTWTQANGLYQTISRMDCTKLEFA